MQLSTIFLFSFQNCFPCSVLLLFQMLFALVNLPKIMALALLQQNVQIKAGKLMETVQRDLEFVVLSRKFVFVKYNAAFLVTKIRIEFISY